MKTDLYTGSHAVIKIKIKVAKEDIKRGIKYIPCLECEGTGIWDYYPNDFFDYEKEIPTGKEFQCINCKGTGKILINC